MSKSRPTVREQRLKSTIARHRNEDSLFLKEPMHNETSHRDVNLAKPILHRQINHIPRQPERGVPIISADLILSLSTVFKDHLICRDTWFREWMGLPIDPLYVPRLLAAHYQVKRGLPLTIKCQDSYTGGSIIIRMEVVHGD